MDTNKQIELVDDMITFLTDSMIRLEKAFRKHINSFKKEV